MRRSRYLKIVKVMHNTFLDAPGFKVIAIEYHQGRQANRHLQASSLRYKMGHLMVMLVFPC